MSYAKQAVTRMTLDMGLPDVQKSLSVTVGDTNRRLEVTLVDRGSPFALPPTWTAVLAGVLPSGDELYESCVVDNGRIVFDFVAANAVSSEEGVFAVAFDVFDEGGELVASPKIWMHVIPGARRLKSPDAVDALTALRAFVGEINKVNSELSTHTEQIGELEDGVSELLDKITTRGTITISANEWTDTLPRLAYVMVDAYTKGTVMLVMPADNTAQVKAREARVRIQAEYRERQICFYRDGDTDPGALAFNYVLLRTNDLEALPCAALVGVDAYGEGGTNTGGVDQEAVEAIVRDIVPEWAREASKPDYGKVDVGLGNVDNVKQYSASNPPPYPVTSVNRKTGAVNLDASDVGADPEGTAQDVANKVAKDLEAYYKKTETYGKDEVNNLISAIPKFAIQPVNSLPTTGISTTTIYLLKNKSDSRDLYTEYIYVNGAWEELGRQKVNLTGYVTESMLTNALKSYALASSVPTKLSQLEGDSTHRTVTDTEKAEWSGKSNFNGSYDNLTNKPTIPTKLSDLSGDSTHRTVTDAEKEAWNAKMTSTQVEKAIDDALIGYITEKDADDRYLTDAALPTKVSQLTNDSGYLTTLTGDQRYAKTTDIPTTAADVGADPVGSAQTVAENIAEELTNYRKKSDTYSKNDVDNLISLIPKFDILVVDSLPAGAASPTTVYLVKEKTTEGDLYTEYIYVKGAWEELGRQTVNLSGYVTLTKLNTALNDYALKANVPTKTSQLTNDSNFATTAKAETWTFTLEDGSTVTKKVVLVLCLPI